MGNRIAKHVYDASDNLEKSTYYILDAQGNTISVYDREVDNTLASITYELKEQHIYGSSRLGVLNQKVEMLGSQNTTYSQDEWGYSIGNRTYEISNHLGNVLAVISDKPIPHVNGSTIDYYLADLRKSTDYSPFGVTLDGRDYSLSGAESYRYGFQGQEMDDEIKGEGNSVNYKYRMHDPRVGRFFAVDPLSPNYPFYSPYSFSGNKVTAWVELEGKEPKWILGWYNLTSSDLDLITDGMQPGDAALMRSVAGKVKQMHDNYVAGVTDKTKFSYLEMKILTGGDRETSNMGGDGYRPVKMFKFAKDKSGRPVTKNTIQMYPIQTIDVYTVHGKTYFNGQLKGSVSPWNYQNSESYGSTTHSLMNLTASSTTEGEIIASARKDAKEFIDGFKKDGWVGTGGKTSDIESIEIASWRNTGMSDLHDSYLTEYIKVLKGGFPGVKINVNSMPADDVNDNAVSPMAIKKKGS